MTPPALSHPYLARLVLAGLAVAVACASSPNGHSQELTGCWYFAQPSPPDMRLPWGVRLGADPLQGWPAIQQLDGVRVASTLTPDGDREHPFGYWRPLPGDSLEIGYPAGGGAVLTLGVEAGGAALTGSVRGVGDARAYGTDPGTPSAGQPVRLTRAGCPEEG